MMVQYPRHAVVEFHPDWAIKCWHCVLCGKKSATEQELVKHLKEHVLKNIATKVTTSGRLRDGAPFTTNHCFGKGTYAGAEASSTHKSKSCISRGMCEEEGDDNNADARGRQEIGTDKHREGANCLRVKEKVCPMMEESIVESVSPSSSSPSSTEQEAWQTDKSNRHPPPQQNKNASLSPGPPGYLNSPHGDTCKSACGINPADDDSAFCEPSFKAKLKEMVSNYKDSAAIAFITAQHMYQDFSRKSDTNDVYRSSTSRVAYPKCLAKTMVTLVHDQPILMHTADVNNNLCLCKQCQMPFHCLKTMFLHMNRAHMKDTYQCKICDQEFTTALDMDTHITKTHYKESESMPPKVKEEVEEFYCDCGQSFKRKSSLKLHIKSVHKREPLLCSICNKVFDSEKFLKLHINCHKFSNLASTKPAVKIEPCNVSFDVADNVNGVVDIEKKGYTCQTCGKCYKLKNRYLSHMNSAHGTVIHHCHFCVESFLTETALKSHLLLHEKTDYKCPSCSKTFSTQKELEFHSREHHNPVALGISKRAASLESKDNPVTSDVLPCTEVEGKSVMNRLSRSNSNGSGCFEIEPMINCESVMIQTLKLKNSTGKKSKSNFACRSCEKKFITKKQLRQHEDLEHSASVTFDCRRCDLKFSSFMELHLHVSTVHHEVHDTDVSL